jgi:S1-C subfamily serine protease
MKKLLSILITTVAIVFIAGCFDTRSTVPYESPSTYESMRINMIATVSPSVIAVKTESGHGSGLIYKQEGNVYYAITNQHVVEDGGEMSIYFGGTREEIAITKVAANALLDVAVVQFESEDQLFVYQSKAIKGEKIEIMRGQDVYAIGTPENLNKFNYVTQGVISLSSFPYNGIDNLAIMHDAELNPGNSGGPLFNLNGELIGINVAKIPSIATKTGSIAAEGLNYALNMNEIYFRFLSSLEESDFTQIERRPRLGVTVQDSTVFLENPENNASAIPSNRLGVVVIGLDETRNAIKYLKINDLIIQMNGNTISTIANIAAELQGAKFGDTHQVTVLRKVNGTFVELTFTIILA